LRSTSFEERFAWGALRFRSTSFVEHLFFIIRCEIPLIFARGGALRWRSASLEERFARGCARPTKYHWMLAAETAAIFKYRISNKKYRMMKCDIASGFAFGYDPTGRSDYLRLI